PGVNDRRPRGLDDHLDDPARAAAELARAARIGAELVPAKEQRKAHLGDFEAAEFDPAGGLPFAGPGPAVAGGRGAAAWPRLKEVPDKRFVGARVLALDRDAKPSPPPGHRAVGAGRGQ